MAFCSGCDISENKTIDPITQQDSIVSSMVNSDTIRPALSTPEIIEIKTTRIDSVVNFAETLIGTPYKYASTDPGEGFDCSGFITYTFNHFNIAVPRSSVDFTNVGQPIDLPLAKRGDLILFTGTDSTIRVVGHMGIVTQNSDTLKFIHSTSGKQYGVTITSLNNYYMSRFVKVIRY
ncbi:MAG: C40 family peptidase [Ferruginibacter sp.]